MIIKSYEIKKNKLKLLINNFFLLYGENLGLKKDIKNFIKNEVKQKNNKVGVLAHTNTKYKGVMNMRYWVNDIKCVDIKSKPTVVEMKNFVRYPNGSWAAQPGFDYDDRVMAMVWALLILENSVIQKYYNVLEIDDNQRPAKISGYWHELSGTC